MIIRAVDRPATSLLTSPTVAPKGVRGVFGQVEVLQLTSLELRESFGISLAEFDVVSPFELAAALTKWRGEPTAAHVRKDRLIRLIDRREHLMPCFVGYQRVPGLGLLPFMTDGAPGKWSLFFEEDGRMSLVEAEGDRLLITGETDLLGPVTVKAERPVRSFLFRGRGPAKPPVVETDPDRRVIRIGAHGSSWQPRS